MEYVSYSLQNGFIANWLVAGPLAVPVEPRVGPVWQHDAGISGTPVERGPLGSGVFHVGAETGVWAYYACPEDHFVDHSRTYPQHTSIRSWAFTEIVSASRQPANLELTVDGPAGLWMAGEAVFQTPPTGRVPAPHGFRIQLEPGVTPVLVRFERLGIGPLAHAMALRIRAEGVHVRIPTLIADIGRRTAFEMLTSDAYVEREVYAGDTPIVVRWPDGERAFCPAHVRLHSADDSIYALADAAGASGDALELGFALQLPAGPFRVTLTPSPDEVYLKHTRIALHVPLWSMGRQRYRAVPAGDLAERRSEALVAVAQHADSPFGQFARMALGAWGEVDIGTLLSAIDAVRRKDYGSSVVLVGLLGMLARWGDQPRFPAELRQPLEDAVLHYSYGAPTADMCESGRLLVHAGEVLAGQRYVDRTFADGRTGAWHRTHGERLALDWIFAFGSRGSAEWGAPDAMERELVALTHLSDLADDTQLYELAAVATDKLLFTLALNSRQGVLGMASQSSRASSIKSGYLQPTAGINWLLWGMGIVNHHLAGVLSLACASGYDPPPILTAIAEAAPAELWSHERHAAPGAAPADLVIYRTPEYVLSSVSSLVPGAAGESELVWRATLGPESVVFANHPGSSSESDSRAPGYWSGNARLPRVAQWKDVVLAMHRLSTDEDVFDFTHAYFPCATFDEYALRDGWAFARIGDGYLALANSRGLRMIVAGRYARREIRAWGDHQTWLVQMGRAVLDGDFQEFQARVLARPVAFADSSVTYTTLRGDVLTLNWSGPLIVNGAPQPAHRSTHFENAYTATDLPCTQMEIRHGADYLRLDFAER